VPKTSSPQQPFKDVIRAHFSSPFPMPAHIVNRVMKCAGGGHPERKGQVNGTASSSRVIRFAIG
jgi:hypothetical protein